MTMSSEYWTASLDDELRLPQCESCSHWVWYPRSVCPACGGSSITWQPISTSGSIFSWTRVRHPYVKELQDFIPLTVVVVELSAGPRVIGWLDGDREPEIGTAVTGEFRQFDGLDERRLVFWPVDKEQMT